MTTTKKNPSEYLKQGWCQGSYSLNKEHKYVLPNDEKACKWCFLGAVSASFLLDQIKSLDYIKTAQIVISEKDGDILLSSWNDDLRRTQNQVVELAIEVEKRMGL